MQATNAAGQAPIRNILDAVIGSVAPSFSHVIQKFSRWARIRKSEAGVVRVEGLKFMGGNVDAFGRKEIRKTIKIRGRVEERIVRRSFRINPNRLLTQAG